MGGEQQTHPSSKRGFVLSVNLEMPSKTVLLSKSSSQGKG